MTRARHQPPSRIKYAQAHPSLGIHVDRPTYDRLMALREQSGVSFAKLVLRALGEIELEVASARRLGEEAGVAKGREIGLAEGREDGYAEAVGQFRVTHPCGTCGAELVVRAGSPAAKAAADWLVENRWGHRDCPGAKGTPEPQAS